MPLRPEVAAQFELTSSTTRLHVPRLGRDIDLTQVGVAEAQQLCSLPGGFAWLRRKKLPQTDAGPVVAATGPAKGKKKRAE